MLNSPVIFCLPSGWPAEAMMSPILCLSPGGGEELWISLKSRTQEEETLRLRMQVGSRGWVSFLCLLFSWVSWCHCSSHLEKQTGDCLVGAVEPHGTWSTWCNKFINTPPSSKHTPCSHTPESLFLARLVHSFALPREFQLFFKIQDIFSETYADFFRKQQVHLCAVETICLVCPHLTGEVMVILGDE